MSKDACSVPAGWVANSDDCNDGDMDINPDAEDVCDSMDNNCNGVIDENGSTEFFVDADHDGFGEPGTGMLACDPGDGYAANGDDCNDGDQFVFPDAPEMCDNVDNDCDGDVDEGISTTFYTDADGDGFGDSNTGFLDCGVSEGVPIDGDCDDGDPLVFPGAQELCDGIDNNCDGSMDDGCSGDPCDPNGSDSTCLACMKSMCCMDYEACSGDPACADCLSNILSGTNPFSACYATTAGTALFYECAAGNGTGTCTNECPIQF